MDSPILKKLNEAYLDTNEAANLTGYTTRWFRYQRQRGLPPACVKIGNCFFYSKAELLGFKKREVRLRSRKQNIQLNQR